jgi:autotransporter strand-loop-strand O-heptosyltransferase
MQKNQTKIFTHGSYIGTTGYNNHTRDFFKELSKLYDLKVRNFTVPLTWDGLSDEPFNGEYYITDLDKKLLTNQTLIESNDPLTLMDHDIYPNYPNYFNHNLNIVLSEVNHHYFYQSYKGPKIGYTVWETTRYPDSFFNVLNEYDQVWVPSKWQRNCSIEQGMDPNKVKVIPEAVNGNTFHPNDQVTLPEYEDNRFKFIVFGRWDFRKSTKEIIESFLQEFNKDEPVDLVLSIDNRFAQDGFKSTEERLEHYKLTDPRIKIKHFPTREEYIKYLQKGHIFLSCARSEGWNLPLIEAMACGTPSIYSNCSTQLEFAQDKGLPVKILGTRPAMGGEYSTYSQSEISGEFYKPDFKDLKKVMRDAYVNYDKHKKRALKESKEVRDKFTWENASKLASKELNLLYKNPAKPKFELSFDLGPKVEIFGSSKKEYFVEFINSENQQVIHSANIKSNMWVKCNKQYYIPWTIKIDGVIVHELNLQDKVVRISIASKSIGDTLAWTPQVVEFQKKHKCKLLVSTFHNEWFQGLTAYKDIEFIKPGSSIKCDVVYKIGWFKENGKWSSTNLNPNQVITIPLQQTATDILGLEFKELNHGLDFPKKDRLIKGKYIVIAPESTAGCKEWPRENWNVLVTLLKQLNYQVVVLSKNEMDTPNSINYYNQPFGVVAGVLRHADLFVGLSSGLSWFNWALNKKTIMINGFTSKEHEFQTKVVRVRNEDVCNSCWVNPNFTFDAGDWDWCPIWKGTDKQHICQKSVTPYQVFSKIKTNLN